MNIVDNPVIKVYERWESKIENVVGKGNCSMSNSQILMKSSKYARIFLMSNPTSNSDLEGNECATTPSFQTDCYATGQMSLKDVYNIDMESCKIMRSMGFNRDYGPNLWEDDGSGIRRVTSRYSRIYTGKLLGE